MGKKKKTDHGFGAIAQSKKVPLLVLDQKWHHLFSEDGKPKEIERLEKKVNKHLARQGRLNQELKELRALKSKLMKNIVANMDEIGEMGQETPKLKEDSRLISEINERMEKNKAELAETEELMEAENSLLMAETMEYCYGIMNRNETERERIAIWISQTRAELKKKVFQKGTMEEKNREIYTYLHDIFGARVLEAFDLKYWAEYGRADHGKRQP
ncbi:hypothetical protein AALC25_16625 [Lachnospiraceae bacterium 29-84]